LKGVLRQMTDIQLLIISTTIGLMVSWFTARQTASSEAVKSLSLALASLRTEFEEVKKDYDTEKADNKMLRRYIELLIEIMNLHGIEVPPMPEKSTP